MTAIFINPQLVVQKNDKFTTGIVYMPITLAYTISNFKSYPSQIQSKERYCFFGNKNEHKTLE